MENNESKNKISGIRGFWDSLSEIDRESVMESLDIKSGFGSTEFLKLPNHIRGFYTQCKTGIYKQTKSLNYDGK